MPDWRSVADSTQTDRGPVGGWRAVADDVAGTEGSIAGGLASAGLDVLGGVGEAFDFLRRTRDVVGHQLGDALYSLGTMSRQGEAGIGESIAATKTGEGLIRQALPEVFGTRREYADLSFDWAWLLGLSHEIFTDPLNVLQVGTLTKAGRGAAKVGKLGITFAKQAAKGQRALLQVVHPTLKGGLGITRTTLVKGPRAVKALGAMGNWLRRSRPYSWFSTELANPFARRARQIAQGAGSELQSKLLAHSDAVDTLFAQVGPEMQEQVYRAAEHIGRPGPLHRQFLRDMSDEVLNLAGEFKAHVDSALDLAQTAGLKRPQLGGEIQRALNSAGREETALAKEYSKAAREMAQGLGSRQRTLIDAAADFTERAAKAQDDAMRWAAQQQDLVPGTKAYNAAVKKGNQAERVARQLEAKAAQARAYAPGLEAGFKPRFDALNQTKKTLLRFQADTPNYVPRVFSPKGQQFIIDNFSKEVNRGKLWTDAFSGISERHFALRYDPKTLAEVTGAGKLSESLLRPASVNEINDMMGASLKGGRWTGGRMEKYAALAQEPTGLIDRLARKTAAVPDAGKVLSLKPSAAMESLNRNIVDSLTSKEFMEQMSLFPEIMSKTAKPGWFPVKELSQQFADQVGDKFIPPELFRELRIMATQSTVGQRTWIGKAFDAATSVFKTSVTTPEALPGIRRIPGINKLPLFPAYHWRNNFSDFVLMGYNGAYSPAVVAKEGWKAASKKGTINAGKILGTIPAEEINRLARAYGITFGEVRDMGSRGIGQMLENSRRMGYFVDRLQHGFSPLAASQEVKKVLFDYSAMNAWERTTFRRVIPFYSWLRNNVHLQVQTLMQKPGLIGAQFKIGGEVQKRDDVPSWVRGRMMIALDPDKQTGEERLLMGLGLPVEDLMELLDFSGGLNEWVRQIGFRIHPAAKLGIGVTTGYDIERARQLDRPASAPYLAGLDKSNPEVWKYLYENWSARRLGKKGSAYEYTIDPAKDFLLRNTLARFYSTAKQVTRPKRATLTGNRTIDELLGYTTGYRVLAHDPERTAFFERRDALRAAADKKVRVGDLGRGEYLYERGDDPAAKALLDLLKRR